ncbi:glycoside hydrolase family 13 protein [Amycolatopsis circi]|uniref:glycoside hydrolase family 13 protein n=1 Tax=Amycolatopsis circi TaxID=871959 RepID=UPI000E24A199|nr:alpha-amylase family glycosyl hydrolase [Amycolatopsis circi]
MPPAEKSPWWKHAVIYQVYIRSFADSDGDGVGDVSGIRSRLPYLKNLGVDALWINPWYPSPMVDAGYDVADYREVDPLFGKLDDAKALIEEAHEAGLRIILDIVPNHTSDQHAWFKDAIVSGPGSEARGRYWFRPGQGENGELPPNDWQSTMGGPAWTRVTEADGTPGEWYLHLFSAEQPDLNWSNSQVRAEFLDILRFWFDLGVDGFRIDVAMALAKDPALPDLGTGPAGEAVGLGSVPVHPHWDRDEVQDIYREWRAVADSYPGDRLFVAEAWVLDSARYQRYLAPGVLHTAFNFGFLTCDWDADQLRTSITKSLREHETLESDPTWVLSNHDVVRHLSRYGRREKSAAGPLQRYESPLDLRLGTRRARAAVFLTLALPGSAYIYQGEELGLWEVEDIPEALLQDPIWERSGHTERGRDGARVPLPWRGTQSPFGFSPDHSRAPWLPQPAEWAEYTVECQEADSRSMLSLYRTLLRIRAERNVWEGADLAWIDGEDGLLAFSRGPFVCAVNLTDHAMPCPVEGKLVAASNKFDGLTLAADSAVWLETS